MISTLLGPSVTAFIVDALAILAAYSILWATVKLSYERAVGKPMPRTVLVLVFDVFAELAVNLPGAFNRATGGAVFTSPKDAEIARLRDRVAVLAADRVEPSEAIPPGMRPTSLPPPGVGMMTILMLALAGCAGRQRGDVDPTAAMVLKIAGTGRDIACDAAADSVLGRTPALDVDNAPRDFHGVVGQIRAWLCSDVLGSLLDLATELVTHPSPSAESDGGTAAQPSTLPAEDSSVSVTGDGGLPSTPTDAGPPSARETSDVDAGEVSP
jgi:hypothetical protein